MQSRTPCSSFLRSFGMTLRSQAQSIGAETKAAAAATAKKSAFVVVVRRRHMPRVRSHVVRVAIDSGTDDSSRRSAPGVDLEPDDGFL
jgi:hypothetical protein